ncbi:hypothetical protein MKX08_005891 [Trichoderma sp. CBMAI-0020]|nr:hypothetical protein MKX08_005891 [Trichoderma sp. CBMAI-0020]
MKSSERNIKTEFWVDLDMDTWIHLFNIKFIFVLSELESQPREEEIKNALISRLQLAESNYKEM